MMARFTGHACQTKDFKDQVFLTEILAEFYTQIPLSWAESELLTPSCTLEELHKKIYLYTKSILCRCIVQLLACYQREDIAVF